MKNQLVALIALSFTLVMACGAESNNARAPNATQTSTCMGDAECGASQTCQKEGGKATGTCVGAAAGSNAQKSTCVGDAECGVGQVCKKESGSLAGTCVKP